MQGGTVQEGMRASDAGRGRWGTYVLITPARDEETFIEETIQSVLSQTVLPRRWVIVSDGSADRTDTIVRAYTERYPWMTLIRVPDNNGRNFASKAHAFNAGYATVKDLDYDLIGNLDADLSFESDYFEYLLRQFDRYPELGVAGTPFVEDPGVRCDYRVANIEHVSGGCQLFRRKCFESIGGYVPIEGGGIDWVAVTTARMRGWRTQTFTGKSLQHLRRMGTGNGSLLAGKLKLGREDYYVGGHPLWEVLRSVYQMKNKPYILGGACILIGYLASAASRMDRPVPAELVAFHRSEQKQRLRRIVSRAIHSLKPGAGDADRECR